MKISERNWTRVKYSLFISSIFFANEKYFYEYMLQFVSSFVVQLKWKWPRDEPCTGIENSEVRMTKENGGWCLTR